MIFYFTGTGNSLYAARNLDTEIISIPRIINCRDLIFKAERIGIVCPVYGHEMPAMVKEFIRRSAFTTDYLYVVLTYGARHANAVELALKSLKEAGKEADYITTLLMVDNFLPGFDMNEQIKIDKQTEQCIGCGICAKVCPAGCIHLEDQKAVYTCGNCQACFACIHACTKKAIQLNIPEKNPHARYRNEHISLSEIVGANNQTEN